MQPGIWDVAGKFSYFGNNSPASNIAMWNGVSWSSLGTGLSGFPEIPQGKSLMFDNDGNLVVGGEFKYAGGVQVNNIARWNQRLVGLRNCRCRSRVYRGIFQWGPRPPPLRRRRCDRRLHPLDHRWFCLLSDAALERQHLGECAAPRRQKRGNTRTFEVMPNGDFIIGGAFKSMGTGVNEFHASHLVRWDGTRFHRFGSGPDAESWLRNLIRSNHLIVPGNFQTIGDIQAFRIARFDGVRWWPYGNGLDGAVLSLELGANGASFTPVENSTRAAECHPSVSRNGTAPSGFRWQAG